MNYQLRQCVHLIDIGFVKDVMLYPWSILTGIFYLTMSISLLSIPQTLHFGEASLNCKASSFIKE